MSVSSTSTFQADLSDRLDTDTILRQLNIQFNHAYDLHGLRVLNRCAVCQEENVPAYRKPGGGWWVHCPQGSCYGRGDLIDVYQRSRKLETVAEAVTELVEAKAFVNPPSKEEVADYLQFSALRDRLAVFWNEATATETLLRFHQSAAVTLDGYGVLDRTDMWTNTVGRVMGYSRTSYYNASMQLAKHDRALRMPGQANGHNLITPLCDLPGRIVGFSVHRLESGVRKFFTLYLPYGAEHNGLMFLLHQPSVISTAVLALSNVDLALAMQTTHCRDPHDGPLPVIGIPDPLSVSQLNSVPASKICLYMPEPNIRVFNDAIKLGDRAHICTHAVLPVHDDYLSALRQSSLSVRARVGAILQSSLPWVDALRNTLLSFSNNDHALCFAAGVSIGHELREKLLAGCPTQSERDRLNEAMPKSSSVIEVAYDPRHMLVIQDNAMLLKSVSNSAKTVLVPVAGIAVELLECEVYDSGDIWYVGVLRSAGRYINFRVNKADFSVKWLSSLAAQHGIDAKLNVNDSLLIPAVINAKTLPSKRCSATFGRVDNRIILPCGIINLDGEVFRETIAIPRIDHPATRMCWDAPAQNWAAWMGSSRAQQLIWRLASSVVSETISGRRGGIIQLLGVQPDFTYQALSLVQNSLNLQTLPIRVKSDVDRMEEDLALGLPIFVDPYSQNEKLLVSWLKSRGELPTQVIVHARPALATEISGQGCWQYLVPQVSKPLLRCQELPALLPETLRVACLRGYAQNKVPRVVRLASALRAYRGGGAYGGLTSSCRATVEDGVYTDLMKAVRSIDKKESLAV
jgi:hypothetical protein